MQFEQGAADYTASKNLAFLKATEKMVKLLQEHGEKPDRYLPQKSLDVLEDERLKQKMKGNIKDGKI